MIMQTAFRAGEGTQRSLREARQDKGRNRTGTSALFSRGDAGTAPGLRAWTDVGTDVGAFYIRSGAYGRLANTPQSGWR